MSTTKLPDLPDMREAGIGLTEALAFWSRMTNDPSRTPAYWWNALGLTITLRRVCNDRELGVDLT